MKQNKIKEDLFGRLLGKEGILEPIIVDQNCTVQGPITYSTIYQALNNVKKGGVIKLMPGVYRQVLEIKNGDIKIQANEPNSNIILISSQYPCVTINLDNQREMVQFESIKFAHSCNVDEGMIENPKDVNYMDDQVNLFETGPNMNTIIYIKRGKIGVEECKFSLNVIKEQNKSIVPAVTLQKEGYLFMSRCELFGTINPEQKTIGVLSKRGSGIIKESSFVCHQKAGLYLSGTSPETIFTVTNCKITKCYTGMTLVGNFRANVEYNVFEKCDYAALKLGMCNRSRINNNTIKNNTTGIEYVNADPSITNNLITENIKDGIYSQAKELIKCQGQIRFNTITENQNSGIRCTGNMNETIISNNSSIAFNSKCGILVEKGAHPHIFKNTIQKNLGQGVLITEGSSALIEKNQISNNVKSNIGLGGRQSINTVIIQNKIHSSRCEGIFSIYGQRFLIANNEIYRNHDGIVAITSIPKIEGNVISNNQANGILLVRDCKTIIVKNTLQKNGAAGIFYRDKCNGTLKKNKFKSNKYELVIQNWHESLDNVQSHNSFQGQLRIPQNYECSIM